ncbi:hypothetical protein GCM10009120_27150 [Sphingobacterium siyangense subsp. cladoniae]|uniref:carboxypeptidase-like regulatory domain-containing protein n=1 Tax=Sphingobacterium siyangense TaxID=459529 RepID=UPI0031F9F296
MTKTIIIFVIFSLYLSFAQEAFTQQISISGKVFNTNKEPINYATVSVIDINVADSIIAYGQTDESGNFRFDNVHLPVKINVKYLGYKPSIHIISKKTSLVNIVLAKDEIKINEVLVNANKGLANIKEDTTKYNLTSLNLVENDNLAHILERIPGFKVANGSKIIHNGQEINKILVNGKEVFNYQNKVALDNVEYSMLENISVVNNYKDPFRLHLGKENEEKVLNLKVKDSFRNILKGTVEVGGNISRNYKVKPFFYNFSEKISAFFLNNYNNIFDKEMANEDFTAEQKVSNTNSLYFSQEKNQIFWNKDITSQHEKIQSNSLTIRSNLEKFSIHSTINYNKIKSLTTQDISAKFLGNDFFEKKLLDSTRAFILNGSLDMRLKIGKKGIISNYSTISIDRNRYNNSFESLYFSDTTSIASNQNNEKQSGIFGNSLSYEVHVFNNMIWKINSLIKYENSNDNWNGYNNSLKAESTSDPQSINFKSIDNRLNSELKYRFDDNNTVLLNIRYNIQKAEIRDDKYAVNNFKRNINSASSLLKYIGKFKRTSLDAQFSIQNWSRSSKDNNYLSTLKPNVSIEIGHYIDLARKNQLRARYFQNTSPLNIKYGIPIKINSFDNRVIGDVNFLTDLNSLESMQIGYYYEYPFKGQSISVSLRNNKSGASYIPIINRNNPFEKYYIKVQGWNDLLGTIAYSQYLLMKIFPTIFNVSIEIQKNKSFQKELEELLYIEQNRRSLSVSFSSFSPYKINLNAGAQLQNTELDFGKNRTSQKQISLFGGPKFETERLQLKTSVKFTRMNSNAKNNDFHDIDFFSQYKFNKHLYIFVDGFNLLQNLNLKNSSLSTIQNISGLEYYSTYKNTASYIIAGIKLRL